MSEESPSYRAGATSAPGQHPRRQDVLIAHLRQAMADTGLAESAFAQDVAREYRKAVPPELRNLDLPDVDDTSRTADQYLQMLDRLRKRVTRYADAEVHMPVELEEAWVAALPAPYGQRCARDLVRRYGFMGVQAPEVGEGVAEDIASVAGLSSRTGHALRGLSDMLANGAFGPEDASDAPDAVAHLTDLAAECHSLIVRIEERVGYRPRTVKLRQA